jgi:formylglycine-generating enzyme required for sulfatase activity
VPGGAFHFGSRDFQGLGPRSTVPEQVAALDPFFIDRTEVTVARYRQALRDGFVPVDDTPIRNDRTLSVGASGTSHCTWNGDASGPAPGVSRESYAIDCVSWAEARALCVFFGGDLPTQAQWEYAATAATEVERRYPWGDEPPACDQAVFGRGPPPADACFRMGLPRGARPVDEQPFAGFDRTPLGVSGMAGNVSEWTLDGFRAYGDDCWWQRPLRGVGCTETWAPLRAPRGGNWYASATSSASAVIIGQPVSYPAGGLGVRCVRPGGGP